MSDTPLARFLRAHLRAIGMSQEELIRASKVPKATVQRWLAGESARVYGADHLLAIARALRLTRLQTNELLAIAGQPSLDQLEERASHPVELAALAPWRATAPARLPAPLTSFVGRERELYEIGGLLLRAGVRLVTLTGPGGSGKTRLALRVAGELTDAFPAGVVFVPFSAVGDPQLVISTIAGALGLQDAPGRDPLDRLVEWIGERRLLLVLDNLEHLLDSGTALAALLRGAPALKLLVTSRVPLRLSAEHERVVRPFTPPASRARLAEARENSAVQLFRERAQAVDATFDLVSGNLASVIELCRRVDGLPLAIELAAARCRTHTPAELLAIFPSTLDLSDDPPRDAEPRHQGLRAALRWSVDLLAPDERRLFAWLGAFRGPARVEDVVAVYDGAPAVTLAGIETLVAASLLDREPDATGTPRVVMLETIREVAQEELLARCDDATARRRHAEHYLGLAAPTAEYVPETRPDDWLERVDRERDNLRAALDWAATADRDLAARLAVALWPWWHEHQLIFEGRRSLAPLLEQADGFAPELRAGLLTAACVLGCSQGDYAVALPQGHAALALWIALGDVPGQAIVHQQLAWAAYIMGQWDVASAEFEATRALWDAVGIRHGVARALSDLALTKMSAGQFAEIGPLLEQAHAEYSRVDDRLGLARSYNDRGLAAMLGGDIPTAIALLEEAVARCRALGANYILPAALFYLGASYCFAGDTAAAKRYLREAMRLRVDSGDRFGGSLVLLGFAAVAWREGQPERAARLCGAVLAVHGSTGMVLAPMVQAIYESESAQVRARLAPEVYERAFAEGSLLGFQAAASYALEVAEDGQGEVEPELMAPG